MKGSNENRTRKAARRKALQILYQAGMTDRPVEQILAEGCHIDEIGVICGFTEKLLLGVTQHINEIDAIIARTSENWSIVRMPLIDLSMLRMAVFEMIHLDDVPLSVSINEAIELAKDFGGEDESPRFINGVLGRIADELAPESDDDGRIGLASPEGQKQAQA
jgi:N utilization substance protein B